MARLMAKHKTVVTPSRQQWSYNSLALSQKTWGNGKIDGLAQNCGNSIALSQKTWGNGKIDG